MEIKTQIAGIPCLVYARISAVEGSYSRNAVSDWDYYGWEEIDFDVLDRRGRPAPWLERKLTSDDVRRIEDEIIAYARDE
jgi:isopentenyldiphosphate isomerase